MQTARHRQAQREGFCPVSPGGPNWGLWSSCFFIRCQISASPQPEDPLESRLSSRVCSQALPPSPFWESAVAPVTHTAHQPGFLYTCTCRFPLHVPPRSVIGSGESLGGQCAKCNSWHMSGFSTTHPPFQPGQPHTGKVLPSRALASGWHCAW